MSVPVNPQALDCIFTKTVRIAKADETVVLFVSITVFGVLCTRHGINDGGQEAAGRNNNENEKKTNITRSDQSCD